MPSHLVCALDELPPGSRVTTYVPGVGQIGVFNTGTSLVALKNACPHQGAPLCAGRVTGTSQPVWDSSGRPGIGWTSEGKIIRCPWHGWEFALETGIALSDPKQRVKTYRVRTVRRRRRGHGNDRRSEECIVVEVGIDRH